MSFAPCVSRGEKFGEFRSLQLALHDSFCARTPNSNIFPFDFRVEPLLYRHVYICDQHQLGLFYRTFRERCVLGQQADPTKDTSPSPRDTQTITIFCENLTPAFNTMFQKMTNLRSIECWPNMFISPPDVVDALVKSLLHEKGEKWDDPYSFKNLRRLCFDAFGLPFLWITFSHRIFRDVAHMTLYFDERAPWESLHRLKNLTHLALNLINHRPLIPSLPI